MSPALHFHELLFNVVICVLFHPLCFVVTKVRCFAFLSFISLKLLNARQNTILFRHLGITALSKFFKKITNFQSLKRSPTRRLPNRSRRRLANVDEAHRAYLDVPVTHVHVSLHQENLHPDPSLTRNLVTQRGLVTTETMATKDLGTTMTMVVMMGRSGNKMPFRHCANSYQMKSNSLED